MRIVLDTNVVISALIWGGTPYTLVEAAVRGDVDLCTSPALIAELRGVLSREHLARRLEPHRASVEEAVALYADLAIAVTPTTVERVVFRDPADDHVVAAAVAAGAELIVTGDRDLLALGHHANIRLVAPADALRLLTMA